MSAECYACSLEAQGDALPIHEAMVRDSGWRVAHAFNSSLPGWLVVLPTRHITAMHELTSDEAEALGPLLRQVSSALVDVLGCAKTYVMLFAEAEGFAHLHLHLVPRMDWFGPAHVGPRVFTFLGGPESDWVTEAERDALALQLREALTAGARPVPTSGAQPEPTAELFDRLHHMQLTLPAGSEAQARDFYAGVLGMSEVDKPPELAARGGAWFRGGGVELHLGVEEPFRPATKGHPGILVKDLDELVRRLQSGGQTAERDGLFPGFRRVYAHDPFGNRLEFLQIAP